MHLNVLCAPIVPSLNLFALTRLYSKGTTLRVQLPTFSWVHLVPQKGWHSKTSSPKGNILEGDIDSETGSRGRFFQPTVNIASLNKRPVLSNEQRRARLKSGESLCARGPKACEQYLSRSCMSTTPWQSLQQSAVHFPVNIERNQIVLSAQMFHPSSCDTTLLEVHRRKTHCMCNCQPLAVFTPKLFRRVCIPGPAVQKAT